MVETGHAWEQSAIAHGEVPEIIGAVDETFLERMFLVLLDLPTGYLWLEDAVEDRRAATWKALVDKRLEALRAPVRSLVSARAKALIQLAEQGLEGLSIPDVFHLLHDIVKSYALASGRQLRQARQEWQKAQDGLQRHQEREPRDPVASRAATRQGETAQAAVRRWATVQSAYRQRRETRSLPLPPLRIDDSTPQTSAQVESQVPTQIEAMEVLAHTQQLPERQAARKQVKKQVPDLAALVDFWWAGVRQDLDPAGVSPRWRTWAPEALLPQV
jgi:hypothetical protein